MADTYRAIRAAGARARRAAEAARFRRALARSGWCLARAALELEVDVEALSRYLARQHPRLCEVRRRMAERRR